MKRKEEMAKFEPGEFVKYRSSFGYEFCRIVGRDGRKYRIFTFSRRQSTADARQLEKAKPAVLILEKEVGSGLHYCNLTENGDGVKRSKG